jgi:hypothetical protein
MPSTLFFCFSYFSGRGSGFCPRGQLRTWSFYLGLPHRWDYRHAPPCPKNRIFRWDHPHPPISTQGIWWCPSSFSGCHRSSSVSTSLTSLSMPLWQAQIECGKSLALIFLLYHNYQRRLFMRQHQRWVWIREGKISSKTTLNLARLQPPPVCTKVSCCPVTMVTTGLSFLKVASVGRGRLFNKWCWDIWLAVWKERNLALSSTPYISINSKGFF